MKRTPIIKVSRKHRNEIKLRRELKAELIAENGAKCMTCGGNGDWRGLSLSHIIPLSQCGKTELANLELLCYYCHNLKHGIREVK